MNVLLYHVGRNLNRAYRTCEAFGVPHLLLLDCNGRLAGNLYAATGRVTVGAVRDWPSPTGALGLEVGRGVPIRAVDWSRVDVIAIGGETDGLPRGIVVEQLAHIPMVGRVSGLTVEAALAIALYEWRRAGEP